MFNKLILTCACLFIGASVSFAGGSGMGGYVHKTDSQDKNSHDSQAGKHNLWPFGDFFAPKAKTTHAKAKDTKHAESKKNLFDFDFLKPKAKADEKTTHMTKHTTEAHAKHAESRKNFFDFDFLKPKAKTDEKTAHMTKHTTEAHAKHAESRKNFFDFDFLKPKAKTDEKTAHMTKHTTEAHAKHAESRKNFFDFDFLKPKAKPEEKAVHQTHAKHSAANDKMEHATASKTVKDKDATNKTDSMFSFLTPKHHHEKGQPGTYHSPVLAALRKTSSQFSAVKDEKDGMPHYEPYKAGAYVGFSTGIMDALNGNPANYQGWNGFLSVGWAHLGYLNNSRLYIAVEGYIGDSIDLRDHPAFPGGNINSIRTTWNFGGDVLPGIMITDTAVAYLRLGGLYTRFDGPMVDKGGWQVGGGAQTNIYKNIDFRGEYVYSQYRQGPNLGIPRTNWFNFGLILKFV